jgi:hypothetical protein
MQKCLPFKKEIGSEFKQDFYFIFLIVTKGGGEGFELGSHCKRNQAISLNYKTLGK